MSLLRPLSIGLGLSTVTFGTLWLQSRDVPTAPRADNPKLRDSIVQSMEHQQQQQSRLKELYGELSILRSEVEIAKKARIEAEDKVKHLEFRLANPDAIPDEFARRLVGIPTTDKQFARLISPTGIVHAEQAKFSSRSGNRISFKIDRGRIAITANKLHPVILRELGFNLFDLNVDERKLQARKQFQKQQAASQAQARIQWQSAMLAKTRADQAQKEAAQQEAQKQASRRQPSPELLSFLIARQARFDAQQRNNASGGSRDCPMKNPANPYRLPIN